MAHPYTSDAQIENHMGTDLQVALATLDSTTDAVDVLADAREDAENEIDAALAQVYTVPFATTPSTPGVVVTMAKALTAHYLLLKRHPKLAKGYRENADRLLERLLSGDYEIPGAARVDASEGTVGIAVSATEPAFVGLDDDGEDRMGDW
jgi:phage gp36-like protein